MFWLSNWITTGIIFLTFDWLKKIVVNLITGGLTRFLDQNAPSTNYKSLINSTENHTQNLLNQEPFHEIFPYFLLFALKFIIT